MSLFCSLSLVSHANVSERNAKNEFEISSGTGKVRARARACMTSVCVRVIVVCVCVWVCTRSIKRYSDIIIPTTIYG